MRNSIKDRLISIRNALDDIQSRVKRLRAVWFILRADEGRESKLVRIVPTKTEALVRAGRCGRMFPRSKYSIERVELRRKRGAR
jgi:hypothetical protein